MARCKDDLEDAEVPVEEGEALAAKSGGLCQTARVWFRPIEDLWQMSSILVQGLSNGYDWRCFIEDVVGSIWNSKKFKRPGLEGEEAVRMTCNLSWQCIEAGCNAFPRSRQKLGRNETFASEAYTIGQCWRDWPQCEHWTRVRIAHITPRTIHHSNLLGIYGFPG